MTTAQKSIQYIDSVNDTLPVSFSFLLCLLYVQIYSFVFLPMLRVRIQGYPTQRHHRKLEIDPIHESIARSMIAVERRVKIV